MQLSFIDHLNELRNRCMYCAVSIIILMIGSFISYDYCYELLAKPFQTLALPGTTFYVKSVIEGVLLKLKFSFLFGIIFSIPVMFFHGLRFCIPALKKKETALIIICLISSFILAILSFTYSYFIVLPTSIKFLMSSHFIPSDVGILLTYADNLLFVFNFITYIILIFQFPIILMALLYLNIISRASLLKSSRYIIVGTVILSAILTPPDVISQLLLSIPLVALFFIVILLAKCFKLGRSHV